MPAFATRKRTVPSVSVRVHAAWWRSLWVGLTHDLPERRPGAVWVTSTAAAPWSDAVKRNAEPAAVRLCGLAERAAATGRNAAGDSVKWLTVATGAGVVNVTSLPVTVPAALVTSSRAW